MQIDNEFIKKHKGAVVKTYNSFKKRFPINYELDDFQSRFIIKLSKSNTFDSTKTKESTFIYRVLRNTALLIIQENTYECRDYRKTVYTKTGSIDSDGSYDSDVDIKILYKKIDSLLDKRQKYVLKKRIEGYDFKEIGKETGVTYQNVQHEFNKIKKIIKENICKI